MSTNKKPVSPFLNLLGIQIVNPNLEPSKTAEAILQIQEKHSQINNVVHGGVLYSICDTLGGYLVWKNVNSGKTNTLVTTIEMKMNYIAPVPVSGLIRAKARLIHLGRRTAVLNFEVFHEQDSSQKLVAVALATFATIRQEDETQ